MIASLIVATSQLAATDRAAGVSRPPRLSVSSGAAGLFAELGTYCWQQTSHSVICVDVAGVPTTKRCLRVIAGRRLLIRTHLRADALSASPLPERRGFGLAQPFPSRRLWALRAAGVGARGTTLVIDTRFPQGDAEYGVRLCPSLQP